jgi:hypothetical protein
MKTLTVGSRRQVWNGTAKRTSGGLTKADLIMSHGRIVSRSKHFSAKKEMRLLKYGYGTQKGKFGYVKIGTGSKKSKSKSKGKGKSRKMRGGMSPLYPSGIEGGNTIEGQIVGQEYMAGAPVDGSYMLTGGQGRSSSRGRSRGNSRSKEMRRGRSMRRGYGMAGGEEREVGEYSMGMGGAIVKSI